MSKNELVPVEQKTVTFYDDELIAIRAEDGHIYVSLRQMCQALGIDIQSQSRRIGRSTVLNDGTSWVAILTTQLCIGIAYWILG